MSIHVCIHRIQNSPPQCLDYQHNEAIKVFSDAHDSLAKSFHTAYWGHRDLNQPTISFAWYALVSKHCGGEFVSMNADVYTWVHARGALVGEVHPFDRSQIVCESAGRIQMNCRSIVALGKLDYMEIVGFSDHRATAAVWYRLLNSGFRIPAGAGTDATTDYAAPIRGQVGMDRVYAMCREPWIWRLGWIP